MLPRSPIARLVIAAAFVLLTMSTPRADDGPPLSVRITSPLGRIGAHTNMRVVAQVQVAPTATLLPIRFYIDGALYKSDEDGPPYAIEWVDENPFERRELAVEVEDQSGRKARDTIVLEPFDVVEEAEVSSVLLEAGVYDKRGRFVNDLGASSFAVLEDGVAQTIDVVKHEELPALFAVLIDSSHSMHRRVAFVRDGVRRFLDFLRPSDRVIVAPFSTHLEAVTGPTNDRKTVLEAISHLTAKGGTAILDSLTEVVRTLPAGTGRRAVVLISDGYDEDSVTPIDQVISTVKSAQVTVYVVGIGGVAGVSRKGEQVLRRLASDTGGQIFLPRDEGLVRVHERLAEDVQNRYLVTYTPTNQKKDGTWREVRLSTTPEYVVRTRAGYTAPKPPPIRPQVEFTITDKNRQYQDLSADDLTVLEDGVEQKIEAFHEVVAPVSIVLALDSSGSMRRSVSEAIEAARRFVLALRPEDALGLMTFADNVTVAHDLTTVRETTLKSIDAYTAVGGTALYDALWDSVMRLSKVDGRRAVVVVSDGRDEDNPGTGPGSLRSKEQVLALIRQVDATVFAIGLGPRVDRPFLEELAGLSGGEAYFPAAVEGLHEDYRRVVESLRRRFVVSYTSTNTVRNGSWRDVNIRPKSPEIVVTSRGGYFAPDR
jgi:VWFA-related protein